VRDPDRQRQRGRSQHAEVNERALRDGERAREQMRVVVADQQRAWKNTIATDHTAGAPPSIGSTILVNIGCTAIAAARRQTA